VTHGSEKSDSFISMVLSLNGRVRPADLHSIPEAERQDALRAYLERHQMEEPLHMVGVELVAGETAPAGNVVVDEVAAAQPTAPAPVASPATPAVPPVASQSAGHVSAGDVDLLLGDYDGHSDRIDAVDSGASAEARIEHAAVDRGGAPSRAASATLRSAATPSVFDVVSSRRWLLWWVPTLVVPLIGGAVAWLALRNTRIRAARAMLAVGIAVGMVASVLFLRFAEPLAIKLNTDTKITLPSTTAKR
jgi:hypothetical protein